MKIKTQHINICGFQQNQYLTGKFTAANISDQKRGQWQETQLRISVHLKKPGEKKNVIHIKKKGNNDKSMKLKTEKEKNQ